MYFTTSIFDTNNRNYHLWSKDHPEFDQTLHQSFSSIAFKPKNRAKKLSPRLFFIKGHFLCYKKKSNDDFYSGVMDLRWARADFQLEESEANKKVCPYKVILIKEEKFTSIHFKSLEIAMEWREALRKIVLMSDFHETYQVLGEIGRGSYAKVNFSFNFWICFC